MHLKYAAIQQNLKNITNKKDKKRKKSIVTNENKTKMFIKISKQQKRDLLGILLRNVHSMHCYEQKWTTKTRM